MALGAHAQGGGPAKTQISDVMYKADGTPAAGTLVIAWPAFITGDNKAVAAGEMTVPIGADGTVSLALAPNVNAYPAGVHYTVQVIPSDGTRSSTEYWTVPTTSPATLGGIRSTLVPAEMALQMVSVSGNQTISGQKTLTGSLAVGSMVLDANGGIVAPANANFVWEGDSITTGQGLAAGQDWASQAMAGAWFAGRGTKYNFAVSGSKTQDVLNRYAAVHALSPAMTGDARYFFVVVGINDIVNTSDAAATIFGRLQAIWASARADGYKIVAATLLPLQGHTVAQETTRQALNLSIRTATGWDYLLDFDQVLPDCVGPELLSGWAASDGAGSDAAGAYGGQRDAEPGGVEHGGAGLRPVGTGMGERGEVADGGADGDDRQPACVSAADGLRGPGGGDRQRQYHVPAADGGRLEGAVQPRRRHGRSADAVSGRAGSGVEFLFDHVQPERVHAVELYGERVRIRHEQYGRRAAGLSGERGRGDGVGIDDEQPGRLISPLPITASNWAVDQNGNGSFQDVTASKMAAGTTVAAQEFTASS